MTYRIFLEPDWDVRRALPLLKQLEEEEPELHIIWDETLKELHAQVMGEVQIEVIRQQLFDRYRMHVTFGEGNIVYKETIAAPVIGMGHFEPLRHYAEVHLLLEPGEPESGLVFDTNCSEDMLSKNWQRLILTHLQEKKHRGVLTGSEITDMRISVIAGKAHVKHTEGGDFRQATYRAVRQGLRQAETILLEPYYSFRLELPTEQLGRAMTDRIHRENTQFLPEKHRLRQYAPIRRICLLIPVVKERCPVSCADIDHATIRKKWLHRLVMIRIWIMRQQRILCLQHMVPAISFLGMKWQIMYT